MGVSDEPINRTGDEIVEIDWEAGKEHFIQQDPSISIADYAEMTPQLGWTGYRRISTAVLARVVREQNWRRAQLEYHRARGTPRDMAVLYGIVMDKITLNPRISETDLARLADVAVKLHSRLQDEAEKQRAADESDKLTADDVKRIAQSILRQKEVRHRNELLIDAAAQLEKAES